jgi:hypothetical protein
MQSHQVDSSHRGERICGRYNIIHFFPLYESLRKYRSCTASIGGRYERRERLCSFETDRKWSSDHGWCRELHQPSSTACLSLMLEELYIHPTCSLPVCHSSSPSCNPRVMSRNKGSLPGHKLSGDQIDGTTKKRKHWIPWVLVPNGMPCVHINLWNASSGRQLHSSSAWWMNHMLPTLTCEVDSASLYPCDNASLKPRGQSISRFRARGLIKAWALQGKYTGANLGFINHCACSGHYR